VSFAYNETFFSHKFLGWLRHCLPTRPVTKGGQSPHRRIFSPLGKCFGHSWNLLNIVQKIWAPTQKTRRPLGGPGWLRACFQPHTFLYAFTATGRIPINRKTKELFLNLNFAVRFTHRLKLSYVQHGDVEFHFRRSWMLCACLPIVLRI